MGGSRPRAASRRPLGGVPPVSRASRESTPKRGKAPLYQGISSPVLWFSWSKHGAKASHHNHARARAECAPAHCFVRGRTAAHSRISAPLTTTKASTLLLSPVKSTFCYTFLKLSLYISCVTFYPALGGLFASASSLAMNSAGVSPLAL